jgi:hypothetical protein
MTASLQICLRRQPQAASAKDECFCLEYVNLQCSELCDSVLRTPRNLCTCHATRALQRYRLTVVTPCYM